MRVSVHLGLLNVFADATGVVWDIFNFGEEAVEYLLAAGRYAKSGGPLCAVGEPCSNPPQNEPR